MRGLTSPLFASSAPSRGRSPGSCAAGGVARPTTSRPLVALAVLALLATLTTACGSGSEATSQLSSSGAEPTPTDDSTADDSTADDGQDVDDGSDADDPGATDDVDDPYGDTAAVTTSGIEIDPSWLPLLEPRFVSQAPLGAIVSLYAEPSSDAELVGSVRAGETGLTLYDVVEEIDGRVWSPVQTADGVVGWIKSNLLRPEPSISPPERIGDSPLRGSDTLRLAVAGLSAPQTLADQIDERGLTMSAGAFVGDEAVVLTADQLRTPAADDAAMITWGLEAGSGDPITSTMTERFQTLAGSTAITSTEATGFNVQVGVGTEVSNIADAFPGAEWVELHFSGTEAFGGLDWESITFVFDTSGEKPILVAITQAAWTP